MCLLQQLNISVDSVWEMQSCCCLMSYFKDALLYTSDSEKIMDANQ